MLVVYFLGGFLVVALLANLAGFRYWLNLWYALDCFLNAVGRGDPRETMSSRLGKAAGAGSRPARLVCRGLDLIDPGHCASSINEDVGRHRVPLAAAIVGLIWLLVAALAVFGCHPASAPEPVEDGLTGPLAGRVVGQFNGQPVPGVTVRFRGATAVSDAAGRFTVTGSGENRDLRFSSPAILPRRTYAWDGDSVWKLVPVSFDTAAYHDLARSYATGTRRWAEVPKVYIDSRRFCFTGGDPALWAMQSQTQARDFIRAWSAGTVLPSSPVVTSSPPADLAPGTIVIRFSECAAHYGGGQYIGWARLIWDGAGRILAGTVHARFKKYAAEPNKRKGILGHELGHTLGYRHMFEPVPSLMLPSIGSRTALLPFDSLAGRFLYGRVPSNTAPDTDASLRIALRLATGGYWEGP